MGACEISPTLNALKKNTKHRTERHRYCRCYIAREKGGTDTVAEDDVYHLGRYGDTNKAEGEHRDGVLVRPRHWTTGVTVCVSRAQNTRVTVRRRGTKALRAFPSVSYKRAKTVIERERQKANTKTLRVVSPVSE